MSSERQNLNDAYKEWADAANRRISNQQQGNNWGVQPTVDWVNEKFQDMNVRRAETGNSPANEKGTEINTTQRRADDLSAALKAAQDQGAPQTQFDSGANLYKPDGR